MSNRVEDLEAQVAELQAAVNGLTEELVEMKERVRQLEDAREAASKTKVELEAARAAEAAPETRSGSEKRTTKSGAHADVVETESADGAAEAEANDGPDMLVPGEDDVAPADAAADGGAGAEGDTPKSEDSVSEEEDGESDDIIVA